MKLIKINKAQSRRLFEAYMTGFSFHELSSLSNDAQAQYDYCCKWLGEPVGNGSSRCIFTLNDDIVLKLAYGDLARAGIEQNKRECNIYERFKTPLLVRIFDHDENFTYIICENVLPISDEDFEMYLGYPYTSIYKQNSTLRRDRTIGFDKYFKNLKGADDGNLICVYDILTYIEQKYLYKFGCYSEELENAINSNAWFKALRSFIKRARVYDFASKDNYGLVKRNGKPMIVLLDSGFTTRIWKKYYK